MDRKRLFRLMLAVFWIAGALWMTGCDRTEQDAPPETFGTAPTTQVMEQPATEPAGEETVETILQTRPVETVPQTTASTEPQATHPKPTEPQVTQPKPTEPTESKPTKPTEPEPPATTAPPQGEVLAGGKWDGGPVTWQITTDGVLTIAGNRSVQGSTNYIWKNYQDHVTKIVIQDGITTIPNDAFQGMTKVTSVYLSNQLKSIGNQAFWNCTALQSVTIPASVEKIGMSAFQGCTALKTLTFAPGCSVSTIESRAFCATGLVSLEIPASMGVVSSHAFDSCLSLTKLVLSGGEIQARAFANCTAISHLVIKAPAIYTGGNTFENVKSIQTLELYSNQFQSFENQTKLTSLTLGGNRTVSGCFQGCSALSQVNILSNVTQINSHAFNGCSALTSFTIPDGTTTIGNHAFAQTGITSITVPASVSSVGLGAFNFAAPGQVYFLGSAPEFTNYLAFGSLAMTVYYPADNATWSEELKSNFHTGITWIAQ